MRRLRQVYLLEMSNCPAHTPGMEDLTPSRYLDDGQPHWTLIGTPDSPHYKKYIFVALEDLPAIIDGSKEPVLVMSAEAGLDFLKYAINLWFCQYEDVCQMANAWPPTDEDFFR
jgi:hypothetical protein